MHVFDSYDEAAAAKAEHEVVCGTLLKNGVDSRYFLLPADAPDEVGRDMAFQIREGRPFGEYERMLLQQVQAAAK